MQSVLKQISKIRADRPINIDYKNSNRYRVILNEPNGTKTAYYFTTPIYNANTRMAVDIKFHKRDGILYSVGSNANITVSDKINMENTEGRCLISLKAPTEYISEYELHCGADLLQPTTNGILYKAKCKGIVAFTFEIEVDKPFMELRTNDKCFSIMKEVFRPFVTASCIGTIDAKGDVIAPAKISYQKLSDCRYELTVIPCSPLGEYIAFELNLYEPKLVQDTTVESGNPKTNNAFGSTAFIGNTEQFGEQWLYSRPDFGRFSDLMDKRINTAVFHLPNHNRADVDLKAFKVSARFCSFGSNWDNKIPAEGAVSDSATIDGYQNIDITSLLSDTKTGRLVSSEGLILKTTVKGSGFSVISTGDSYYAPQIFEINYK